MKKKEGFLSYQFAVFGNSVEIVAILSIPRHNNTLPTFS